MALIKCKECGNEVSKNAESCPKCGAPIRKKPTQYGCGTLILLIIVGFVLIGVFSSNDSNRISYTASNNKTTNSYRDIRYAHKTINIREGAGKSHKVVGQLKRGDAVEVKEVQNKWAKISVGGVEKGYVYEPLLKYNPIPPLEIADWNWYSDSGFGVNGAVIWNVEVRNNTSRYIELVKVEFSTYDSSDKLITTDYTYVKGLSPGGTATAKSYATYFGREKTGRIRIVQ